jgi:cobalt-zinc-cadmium efflux system membrane fusion protein
VKNALLLRLLRVSRLHWAVACAVVGCVVALVLPSIGCKDKESAAASVPGDAAPSLRVVSFDPAVLTRLGIRVESAGMNGPAHTVRVSGTLDYDFDHYAEVGALLPGRISAVEARVGDAVHKGQTLATIVVPSIAESQAGYLTAKAAAQAARKNRDREAGLLDSQLTTAREAEVASSEAAKADADLAAAEAKLHALRVDLPDNDRRVTGAGTYRLIAPIDGIVVRRDAVLGGFLEPNMTAFVVADLDELRARLEIFEGDLPYVRAGSMATLTFDAMPGKVVQGRVALMDPALGSATRTIHARVVVPNPDGDLRPGLFVRAAIELPPQGPANLLVPAGAVQPLGSEDVVFVERTPGSYEVRPVQLARRTSDVVDVTRGLARGEDIVVEGAFLLRGEVTRQ